MDLETAHSLVLSTLERAASQNAEILKPAENKLKEWEVEPGFYSILFNIFSNHNIDVNVRWIAVLYFKNGIDKYWRKTAPNAIAETEKVTLRQGLINTFNEPVNQIATQISVLISKIARYDCPREWPDLITTLLTAVKSENHLILHRSLLTLHHVIKTLSSKRLAGDKKLFQDLTANIYNYILTLWHSQVTTFLMTTSETDLEKALLSLKILRRLTVHGFKKPNESQDVNVFIQAIFERAKTMLELKKSLNNGRPRMTELCEKFIVNLTKVLLEFIESNPFSYISFIKTTLDFTAYYLFNPAGESLVFERFIIQCFNLIKHILACAEYKPAKVREMTKDPETLLADTIKHEFFTESTLNEMCRKLVYQYFLLTREELQEWDADPEKFSIDEGGESWKYSLRPCIETLFTTFFHEFRDFLSPLLLEMIRENHDIVEPNNLEGILRKDAVYNAVGMTPYDLYDTVDFDNWFSNTLIHELRIKDSNYRILRRRVVWLLGQWSSVKFSTDLRPVLYGSILPLLHSDEDMSVRIAAVNALRITIDDFEFNTEQFLPYLETAVRLLFSLLKEATECEIKLRVLYVMSFMVDRVGSAAEPYFDSLIDYLPMLWQESTEHNMLRCVIVTLMVHVVNSMGANSTRISNFLIPMIKLSTDLQQDSHIYLLEDGLDLWQAVLENAPAITDDLLQLFQNMPRLLELGSENLRTCFSIIQAYILLSPSVFLNHYGQMIIVTCNDMLSDLRAEGVVMIMRMVELCLRALPGRDSAELVSPLLPRIIEAVRKGEDFPVVLSMYLSVISRVLLSSKDIFGQALRQVAAMHNSNDDILLNKVLEVWLMKMSLISQIERRKLLGLALASLLTAQSKVVLDHSASILLNLTEVLNDITKTDHPQQLDSLMFQLDSLMINSDQTLPTFNTDDVVECETEHELRRKQLSSIDPVHTIALKDYLQNQVNELKTQIDETTYKQLMQTLDSETLEQLTEFIKL